MMGTVVIEARPETMDDEIWQKGNKVPEYPSLNTAGDLILIEACAIVVPFLK